MKRLKNIFSNKKFGLLLLVLLFWGTGSIIAQINSHQENKLMDKADKVFEYGDFLSALVIYNQIYPFDSTSNELNYKLGVCNFEIKKFRTLSKKQFDKVSPDNFPEVNYYLGRLYHLSKEYEKAIGCFNKYNKEKGEREHTIKEIEDLIEKCHTAMLFEATEDKTISIENMGSIINTVYPEYAPLIPAEENFLLFTSRRKNIVWQQKDPLGEYFEDIYISKKDAAKNWQTPVMLDTNINTSVHDACTGLSADGEKMLIYRTSKDLKSGDIYESFYSDNKWSNPLILNANVNSEYLETSACYSPDGNIIFFSSNRSGGFGGKDIYSVKKLPNGKWSQPFNLGPNINTEYNEDAPFVHPAGNILFFSSEGHKNMGGFDIFKSTFDEDGSMTKPQNLGYPINTVDDDIFFVLNTDASIGYFSSERDGGYGSQDIYRVYFKDNTTPLNAYDIHVMESDTVIKKVEIVITDMEKKEVYGVFKSNPVSGKLLVLSRPKKTFQLLIQAPGYEPLITNYIFDADNEIVFKLKRKQ